MRPSAEQRLHVKEWFDASGTSISEWAGAHGFKAAQVYDFLSGRTSGRRGVAYEIAVALKLKSPPQPLDLHIASLRDSHARAQS